MKTLILCGSIGSRLPAPTDVGGEVIARDEIALAALRAAGREASLLQERLGRDGVERVERAACDWTRAWGRRPLLDGQSFRELLAWEGLSLWWFVEPHLFRSSRVIEHVRGIERFRGLLDALRPDEVEAVGLPQAEELLLERTCVALGILFHGQPRLASWRLAWQVRQCSLRARWRALTAGLKAVGAARTGEPAALDAPSGRVLFLSHTASSRLERDPAGEDERQAGHDSGGMTPGVEAEAPHDLESLVLSVGPAASHDTRSLRSFSSLVMLERFREASAEARRLWVRIRGRPALRDAFSHAGVRFDDLAAPDLAGLLLLQAPWAVRSYEEMKAALLALKPSVVCLAAEDSDWGRVAEAACRRAGIPTIAMQRSLLYPSDESYLHAAREASLPEPSRGLDAGSTARILALIQQPGREERVLR